MAFSRKNGRRFRFESLEQRRMMAGDVSVKLIAGDLYIQGDYLDNKITIAAGGAADQVVVSGLTAGGAATSINGTPNGTTTVSGFTGNLVVSMEGGNDNVAISNLTIRGNAEVKTGQGNDTLTITGVTARGRFLTKLGSGTDDLIVSNSTIYGKTKIRTVGGNDSVTTSSLATKTLNTGLGRGNDTLSVTNTTTARAKLKGGHKVNTFTDGGGNHLYNARIHRFG